MKTSKHFKSGFELTVLIGKSRRVLINFAFFSPFVIKLKNKIVNLFVFHIQFFNLFSRVKRKLKKEEYCIFKQKMLYRFLKLEYLVTF